MTYTLALTITDIQQMPM